MKTQTLDADDGGYGSRKFWFAGAASTMVFAGAYLASQSPAFAAQYQTMVGGLLAITSAYLTGNVASRWVTGNHFAKMAESADGEEDPPDDELPPAHPTSG